MLTSHSAFQASGAWLAGHDLGWGQQCTHQSAAACQLELHYPVLFMASVQLFRSSGVVDMGIQQQHCHSNARQMCCLLNDQELN